MSDSARPAVLVSIVTYNSGRQIQETLASLVRQNGFELGTNLAVVVFDNGSEANYSSWLKSNMPEGVSLICSSENLGFSGAHNVQATRAIGDNFEYLLVLNPDAALEESALEELVRRAQRAPSEYGAFTPLLLRADQELQALKPPVVDSTGIVFTADLRHFDRDAGSVLKTPHPFREEEVLGGTGACLLISREMIKAVSFRGDRDSEGLLELYPQLAKGIEERVQLFDEAFFAYREDAELALRAQRLGVKTLFVPSARVFHQRQVTPERRGEIAAEINALSVRNRFLLQLLHLRPLVLPLRCLSGFLVRNLVVVLAVFLREFDSRRAFREVWLLRQRCLERSGLLMERGATFDRLRRWF